MSDNPIDDLPDDRDGETEQQTSLDFPGPEDQDRRRDDLPRPDDEPVTDEDREGIEDAPGVPLT